ncbi:DUF262 domain-containing protein [Microbacterium hydrocarbonoxydans]|uniref:DUF262 domain-containing protein n=1 Tax=Microbacterium hydrocarbonoxydans TaxID=273678 RepID=UPI0020404686|nr:DUF262 domain-containing protein [Microbacterium hydrocarbonoxydans]MCM3778396.1 DUF262 domain-containing protein [Microbacterium hydrocarbonoxydans]
MSNEELNDAVVTADVDDESHADDATVLNDPEEPESTIDSVAASLPYFGADFDVAGLVRRLADDDIVIPRFDPDESSDLSVEGFQRQRVWTKPRMEKFIESLLLGWPVPNIFLVVEPDGKYLVLDGQQRLTTLSDFYNGEFSLEDVVPELGGANISNLSTESRRRLNNTFIQAVVIEPSEPDGRDSVYRLFGRLNSGGVALTPQEIRVALYRGPLVNFIRDLNHNDDWRILYGLKNGEEFTTDKKLKDHELILRSLVMSDVVEKIHLDWDDKAARISAYRPPMVQFLNSYLDSNRQPTEARLNALESAFKVSCQLLNQADGREALRFAGRLNAAHIDALLANLIFAAENGLLFSVDQVRAAISDLRTNEAYIGWISGSTSHRDSVYGRLKAVREALLATLQ